ncbi:hypothetical protein V6N13_091614 [Hibiscus sabdariffa]
MLIENGLGSGQMNWRGLFAANESHSLQFFPPCLEDGKVKIKPPSEVFDAGIKVWGNSLVAQFLDKPPSSNSHFLDFSMEKFLVWVHLSGVPLELFTNVGLSYVASALGTPFYMDGITANKQRLAYAKVRVEMSVDFKIPSFISVMLRDGTYASVGVEVPWLPAVIVEGTTASILGNECPLDLGVVQTTITSERGKAPLESIGNLDDGNEHKPIHEATKNVAVMM